MKPIPHAVLSAIVSSFVYYHYRSLSCAIASFSVGFFIDADHFFDYYMNHGFSLNIGKIHRTMAAVDIKRIYVILHAYEFALALWIGVLFAGLGPFWASCAIGLTQHLIADQLVNGFFPLGYFITYRAWVGFKEDRVIKRKRCCA